MSDPAERRNCAKWIGRANCQSCRKRKHSLFASLSPGELASLPPAIDQFEFAAGADIFYQGEPVHDVFIVSEGLVKAAIVHQQQAPRVVRLFKPGDALGLEALLEKNSAHRLSAVNSVVVCRIPVQVLRCILEKSHGLMRAILGQWHENLQRADYWLTRLCCGSVEQRVSALLQILSECDYSGRKVIELPAAMDIAAIINTTRESVSREVAKLKRERVLVKHSPRTYLFMAS